MSNLITLATGLAESFGMNDGSDIIQTLKATAFKGPVTDSQMTALLIIAKSYGLNPWTRELYAFPDKGGIVPVVGVDGWSRIINSHPQYDGMDFEQNAESCTCIIYRKDRGHPTKVTEWMAECKRNAGPWLSHPYRMLRHKALIQCARLAFGFVGIFDQDEAERIAENTQPAKVIDPATGEIKPAALPVYTDENFEKNLPAWRGLIESGKKTAEQIIATVSTKATMSEEQTAMLRATVFNNIIDMEPA